MSRDDSTDSSSSSSSSSRSSSSTSSASSDSTDTSSRSRKSRSSDRKLRRKRDDGKRNGGQRHKARRRHAEDPSDDSKSDSDTWDTGNDVDDEPSHSLNGTSCLFLSLILAAVAGIAIVFGKEEGSTGTTTSGSGTPQDPGEQGESSSSSASPPTKTGTSGAANSSPTATGSVELSFLESLASSYSMTPARISTLPAPSSALPSASPAMSYLKESWPLYNPSDQEFVAFVHDPLDEAGSDGPVLSVEYPEGSYSGNEGGANLRFDVFGEGKVRAMLSYEVGFEVDFPFVKGGKLPGLFGGDPMGHCTGGKGSTDCFSLRFMWREGGAGEVYAYVPVYDGFCDDKISATTVSCHDTYGQSFNRGSFTFEAGKYNTITEVAILNSDPSTNTEANGYLAVYAGETLAFERTEVVFRTNASVFFSSVQFQTFFGGSSDDYASTRLTHTYYRNWRFYEGDDASSESGTTVEATIEN
ncbi:hypothetical protein JCM10212_003964 [Sporobolomyces blumeae]